MIKRMKEGCAKRRQPQCKNVIQEKMLENNCFLQIVQYPNTIYICFRSAEGRAPNWSWETTFRTWRISPGELHLKCIISSNKHQLVYKWREGECLFSYYKNKSTIINHTPQVKVKKSISITFNKIAFNIQFSSRNSYKIGGC